MNSREIVMEMDIPFLPAQQIKVGNIELMYEQGRVRYIKYRGQEVLRMIYPALRDENWETIKPEMQHESISVNEKGFVISYQLTYHNRYKAFIEITGDNDRLIYTMQGEALESFKSKRVGLCVHHPIHPCAGKEVIITHDGNNKASYIFPVLISNSWPFTDITSMQWKTENAEAILHFEGDVFETEDQRNWTDDSYKTYSGPQYKTPMLDISKGDKMMHRVTLRVNEAAGMPRGHAKSLKFSFPRIGYSRSADQSPLTPTEIELIKQIPFDHYRVQLNFEQQDWKTVLAAARAEAQIFNIKIELEATCTAVEEAVNLIKEFGTTEDIESLLIISESHYNEIQSIIRKSFPQLKIGFSTGGWFADLNSALPLEVPHDFLSFKMSPQVHQDDNRSILENLGSQHTLIETIKEKAGDKAVHVSPVLFNHNGDDERLHTSFGAWWTINAICNLAGAGHITLFELKGPRGIIYHEQKPSPLFRLLKSVRDFKPVNILKPGKNEIVIENQNSDQVIFHKKSTYE